MRRSKEASMALPTKPILFAAVAVLLAAAGWFGWQHFSNSGSATDATSATPAAKRSTLPGKPKAPAAGAPAGPAAPAAPPPAASTPASAPANPDQLVDEVIVATGLAEQLNTMSTQIVTGITQGFASQPQASRALSEEVGRIAAQSYTPDGFQQRVRDALKARYDEKHLSAMLATASTPVAKKMTKLELAQPSESELAAYAQSLVRNPLPAQRQALLEQLIEVNNTVGVGTEIALASMRALAMSASGGDPRHAAEIDRTLESRRPALAANIRKGALVPMAYTYRDASDAELTDYVKLYQSEHGKWFTAVVSAAMVDEVKTASGQFGDKIVALARSRQPAGSAMARAGERAADGGAQAADEEPPAGRQRMASRPLDLAKRNMDLRSCLELPSNDQIIRCAERGL
jgi:hypothetical protein